MPESSDFEGKPVIQDFIAGPPGKAVRFRGDVSDSIDGLKQTLKTVGFDTKKWNAQTFEFVSRTVDQVYRISEFSGVYTGVSKHTATTMPQGERGLNKIPIENAVRIAISDYRDDIIARKTSSQFEVDRAIYGTELVKIMAQHAIISGLRPLTPDLFQKGNIFEGVKPPSNSTPAPSRRAPTP